MKKRVCFGEALYPLTFYLLFSTKEQIDKTIFVVDRRIDKKIYSRLPNVVYDDLDSFFKKNSFLKCFWSLFIRPIKYKFLFEAEIFGLDFKWEYLRGLKMSYIEDAPNIFNIWETGMMYENYIKHTSKNRFLLYLDKLLFGQYHNTPVATSKLVTDYYVCAPTSEKKYLEGKKEHILNWQDLWKESSESKKEFILNLFNISPDDIVTLQKKKVLLLTQAFYEDNMCTEKEQIDIYSSILNRYDTDQVLIKPHPRDRIEYKCFFPAVTTFDKVVPLQFLALLGIKFDTVVTVSSSAALCFGYKDVKIDWIGGDVHPGIIKAEGKRTLEMAIKQYKQQYGEK